MDCDLSSVLNEEDDEQEITAEAVLKTLESSWLNERFAPEILPHQHDMIECMLGQIHHMEQNINKLPKTDLRVDVHRMELNRIKFIISSYLRTRIKKIETFCISIMNDEKQRTTSRIENYLTKAEQDYAREYISNMETYLKSAAINSMPGNMQNFDPKKMAINPNLYSHIFLKANKTVNNVVLESFAADQDEEIDLEEGSQHILQYKPVAELVKTGFVQLI